MLHASLLDLSLDFSCIASTADSVGMHLGVLSRLCVSILLSFRLATKVSLLSGNSITSAADPFAITSYFAAMSFTTGTVDILTAVWIWFAIFKDYEVFSCTNCFTLASSIKFMPRYLYYFFIMIPPIYCVPLGSLVP